MELYIIRHGETVWNKENRLQGRADIALNDNGREMAIKTGIGLKNIRFDAIYASPLKRAYETADLICKDRNIEIIKDERLIEISFGKYEGKTYEELEEQGINFMDFFKNPDKFIPAMDGEGLGELCSRAKDFLDFIVKKHGNTDERIMIVAHGAMNKAIMLNVKNISLKDFWSGGLQKNCNAIIVKYENTKFSIIEENRLFYNEI
ncbi:MAG: histidine phosphatase family protein [Lachnospiraceae bacterium]|nr:histidine phosphatase family protein [Lachnospiraceae bacterium]